MRAITAETAEIAISCQRIKYLRNFILYCIRYGVETFHYTGAKIGPELKIIDEITRKITLKKKKERRKNGTTNDTHETNECVQYIEHRREERATAARLSSDKRKNVVEAITHLIKKYKITTYAD